MYDNFTGPAGLKCTCAIFGAARPCGCSPPAVGEVTKDGVGLEAAVANRRWPRGAVGSFTTPVMVQM